MLSSSSASADENISSLLLRLCGFPPARLRMNARNKTQNLTWRSLTHLYILNETRIIGENPPSLPPGAAVRKPALQAALKFVLTGIDDSSLVGLPDPKETKANRAGQREAYLQVAQEVEREMRQHEAVLRELPVVTLEAEFEVATAALTGSTEGMRALQDEKRVLLRERELQRAALRTTRETLRRFGLLREHYGSDLRRLRFLGEGDHYFGQLRLTRCPTCGAPMTPEHEHAAEAPQAQTYALAIAEELHKVEGYLQDLNGTVAGLETQAATQEEAVRQIEAACEAFDVTLRAATAQHKVRQGDIARLTRARMVQQEALAAWQRRATYHIRADELTRPLRSARPQQRYGIDGAVLRQFADVVGSTLRRWNFPLQGVVEMDDQSLDFRVAGRGRSANGKGYRALLNSAFVLSVLRYCDGRGLPHPGVLILDSPLTTFRQDRKFLAEDSDRVHASFLADLLASPEGHQIIVLENTEISDDVRGRLNHIEFSREKSGARPGFFPVP
ncbi:MULTISPECIES: hypothetical protein [Deinococcus]|uniref:Uncharacterized protein n=1 Tax=Deinococcus rufus TaxID=2136097 RepID=A0ABV7Z6H4_9DEIO|nr:hypothetical protein [Deinococcus sp. AB2017081]WQE97128.1 hypothetical protein U2P90_18800 [Deinococcus sp. AB2017081]